MASVSDTPSSADRAVDQAIEALKSSNPASALPPLEAAVRRAPEDGRLWHLIGLIHRAEERRELALPVLERALQLLPRHPLVAHGLARTRFEAGLSSVDDYARALQLAPGDLEMMKGLVAALNAERRVDDAMAGLVRALSGAPLWVEGHLLLSDLRWIQGEREGFARSFDEALAVHPLSLELRRQQIITLLHAEQYDATLTAIENGRRAIGENALFAANEAIVHAEMGNIEQADLLFAPLADMANSSVQIRRIRHLLRSGRAEQASEVIDAWLATPEAFAFWPYAATTWRMTGDSRLEWLTGDHHFVAQYDLAERLPPLETLAGKLRELHRVSGQPLAQSVRGGSQTDGHLFHLIDPAIVSLREAVRKAVKEYVTALPPRDPRHPLLAPPRAAPITFAGAWSVRLRSGGFHSNHVHPFGWISSVLYIALPPDVGAGIAGWLTLGEPRSRSLPLDLEPLRLVEPKPGRLVLFPSWMWHGTRPFGSGERLTVAFDVAVPRP
ncbi:MAG: putative 2OG-Fe(II) oxygenase [Sphingomicrobium sp.]